MATQDPDRLPDAVDMLKNQQLEAHEFVRDTLMYPSVHPDFPRAVIDVMQVLAINELTLARGKSK